MRRIYVGTGGWSLNQPPYSTLRGYCRYFDFVEVNSTFYEIPPLHRARLWRRSVPEHFIFAVKCSRIVTHEERLRATKRSIEYLDKTMKICDELRARVLVLQTPISLQFKYDDLEAFRNLVSCLELGNMSLGLDPGGRYPLKPPSDLVRLMQDLDIIHIVDLLREKPVHQHSILYSRLFGVKIQDEDLRVLLRCIQSSDFKEAYAACHYLKMVDPALRLSEMIGLRSRGLFMVA